MLRERLTRSGQPSFAHTGPGPYIWNSLLAYLKDYNISCVCFQASFKITFSYSLSSWRWRNLDNVAILFLLFSDLTLLVWRQERHPDCKKLGVGLLVVIFDWSSACLIVPVVATISIFFSSNKTG